MSIYTIINIGSGSNYLRHNKGLAYQYLQLFFQAVSKDTTTTINHPHNCKKLTTEAQVRVSTSAGAHALGCFIVSKEYSGQNRYKAIDQHARAKPTQPKEDFTP